METNEKSYRGGEEVMMDVGGQDATEAFEDVGHSDEAREILSGLLVGNLKRQVCPSLDTNTSLLSHTTASLNELLISPVARRPRTESLNLIDNIWQQERR